MANKEYVKVGECRDFDGARVEIGQFRDLVLVTTTNAGAGGNQRGGLSIDFGPAERSDFMQLFAAAERMAEAWVTDHPDGGLPALAIASVDPDCADEVADAISQLAEEGDRNGR